MRDLDILVLPLAHHHTSGPDAVGGDIKTRWALRNITTKQSLQASLREIRVKEVVLLRLQIMTKLPKRHGDTPEGCLDILSPQVSIHFLPCRTGGPCQEQTCKPCSCCIYKSHKHYSVNLLCQILPAAIHQIVHQHLQGGCVSFRVAVTQELVGVVHEVAQVLVPKVPHLAPDPREERER